MATGSAVAVYRKRSKKDLFSNKNEAGSGREEMENILPLSQETNPERVYEIDFHASKLTKIENFGKFSKLRCLDLSCNEIKFIKALDKNIELKELKLYSNRITKLEGLDKLRELCSLLLHDNKISKLGEGLHNLKKLKSLRVDCNEILTISVSEIAACSKLTFLNVSSNKLTDISFINCLQNLEEFYASHNRLVRIPDLGRCKKLQELDVSFNEISSIAGLKSLPFITTLRLEHNAVKEFDISSTVSTLEELYVGNNELTNVKLLPLWFPSISVVDLSANRLDNLAVVCKDLSQCGMLQELNIVDNPCFNSALLDYHSCLKALPSLEVLNGSPVTRPQSSHGKTRPPMRPVSASQMVSTKYLEEQVSLAIHEQNSFESMISSKFDVVYDLLKKLPEKPEVTTTSHFKETGRKITNNEKPSSLLPPERVHHQSSTQQISALRDISQLETQTSESNSNSQCLDSARPSSRCSNRARLQHAITFAAEQHFD